MPLMPKKRLKENCGLPKRWKKQHGAYYYRVPPGLENLWDGKKMFRLGKTEAEAYKEWIKRVENTQKINKVSDLLDRYQKEVIPTKAANSQRANTRQIKSVRSVFGEMGLMIEPRHIYQYFDKRDAKVSAKREIALLSHALTKAVEWGCIDKHPFKGEIRLPGEKSRERYVEDWEIAECFKLEPLAYCNTRLVQAFIAFSIVSGLRKQDILTLKVEDLCDDGIRVKTQKTGKSIVIKWTPTLKFVTQQLLELRPVDISPWVMCSKSGFSYYNQEKGTCSGWDSIWARFMDRAIKETDLKNKFTMHDLRAKCASDIKDSKDAQKLLAHENINMTMRYRRKPEVVSPLR